jgi:hypothetical protein
VNTVSQWDIFELALPSAVSGNPFTDVRFAVRFAYKHRTVTVEGFYDGEETFRVRFMPDALGEWRYETLSSLPALHGKTGTFTCVEAEPGAHGPVRVHDTYHFAYADGTPYHPFGTTCYAWTHQGDTLEDQTLETLQNSPFNKLRMCVFPKDYDFNKNEPPLYPFEPGAEGGWDYTRFHPAFFRHLEARIGQLRDLGIEADLILFHPYDRWGYADMGAQNDDRYLRYVVARLAAYRNVWWSLANEWDLLRAKTLEDWDRFFRLLQEEDPYQHLRSIHNCVRWYDHGRPWVTHASVQNSDLYRMREWRGLYRKPIVVDECCYEGNLHHGWGNICPLQMVNNFWVGTVHGGYVGHGETYLHPEEILWWSKGGILHGESPARIAFLRRVLEEGGTGGLEPTDDRWDHWGARRGEAFYLFYFGKRQPVYDFFTLPEQHSYQVDILDIWNMTVTPVEGRFQGRFRLELPGRPYLAVRMRRVAA